MRARSLSPTSTSCLPILDSSLSHLLGFLGIDEQTKYLSPPMYEPVVVVCTLASSITYSILPPISCQLSKWEVPTLSSSSSLLLVHMCTTPTTPNVYSVKKKRPSLSPDLCTWQVLNYFKEESSLHKGKFNLVNFHSILPGCLSSDIPKWDSNVSYYN